MTPRYFIRRKYFRCTTSSSVLKFINYNISNGKLQKSENYPTIPNKLYTQCIGKHYAMYHPTHKQCQLTFTFIDKQSNSVRRKISKAIKIHKDKPNFNNKEELVDNMKFIVR